MLAKDWKADGQIENRTGARIAAVAGVIELGR
jgi:hypothetical protein